MLQLQSNVPLPVRKPVMDRRKKYPVEKMKVGDFFFVARKRHSSIRTYFSALSKQHGIKLKAEQIHARQGDHGWEQCPEDTPGAVSGGDLGRRAHRRVRLRDQRPAARVRAAAVAPEAELFWTTSISVIQHTGVRLVPWMSKLFPSVDDMRAFLEAAIANDWVVVTWNGIFDVAILIAYGLRDLVYKVKWLDGLLLWKHLEIDPEYDVDKPKKKSYSLKPDAVCQFIPQFATRRRRRGRLPQPRSRRAGQAPALQQPRQRAHAGDRQDDLEPADRAAAGAALIEAAAIPLVAEANLNGIPIDPLFAGELSAWLKDTAASG
jgi:hypothetical protein